MNRRKFLLSASALFGAAGLAACVGTTLSQLAQDAQGALAAANAALAALPAGTAVPATLTTTIADMTQVVNALASATTSTTSSLASQLIGDAKAVIPILSPMISAIPGIGPDLALGLAALQAFIPALASDAGLTSASFTVAVGVPSMTIAEARARYNSITH